MPPASLPIPREGLPPKQGRNESSDRAVAHDVTPAKVQTQTRQRVSMRVQHHPRGHPETWPRSSATSLRRQIFLSDVARRRSAPGPFRTNTFLSHAEMLPPSRAEISATSLRRRAPTGAPITTEASQHSRRSRGLTQPLPAAPQNTSASMSCCNRRRISCLFQQTSDLGPTHHGTAPPPVSGVLTGRPRRSARARP